MNKECTIDGCMKKVHATGMCAMHYYRMKRTGKLTARPKAKNGAALAWIRGNASHEGDDCLFWPFGKSANGYAQVRLDGVDVVASRYMCLFTHGEPPTPDHEAAHRCGNGHLGCVNPRHLRWATRAENMEDMIAHGNSARGSANPASKLTAAEVLAIRDSDQPAHVLAARYKIKPGTVRDIASGRRWSWLTPNALRG